MIKKTIAVVMAVACIGMAGAQQPGAKAQKLEAAQAKKERQSDKPLTLDKQKPDPRPGEGFLIRGREGAIMDKGRPDTTTSWDLWRK